MSVGRETKEKNTSFSTYTILRCHNLSSTVVVRLSSTTGLSALEDMLTARAIPTTNHTAPAIIMIKPMVDNSKPEVSTLIAKIQNGTNHC